MLHHVERVPLRFPLPQGEGQGEGMKHRPPSTSVRFARQLRRSQTAAERLLWHRLRDRQLRDAKFRRQVPIGRYVVDFCCLEHKLIVELDGGQHAERLDYDAERTAFLERSGYRVIRFWNPDVTRNLVAVLTAIDEAIGSPHPDPLPAGEGTARSAGESPARSDSLSRRERAG
jgi:very-short-patch-repair endonuclease